jgi:hypothetical protein
MFPLAPGDGQAAGQRLARVLKALRRHRRLRPGQVARAMAMPLRSYEHFESGCGRLNLGRVQAFAEATDTDSFAILASLALDSPELAVRCADNKLMLIFMMALQDFDAATQDDIARLEPRTLITAFTRMFDELGAEAARRDSFLEDWFTRKGPSGGGPPPEGPEPA